MTINIDPAALEATSRDLLRHDLAVADAAAEVLSPDTGETTEATAEGVARLLHRAGEVADGLHALADALDTAAALTWEADASVSTVFAGLSAMGRS